jgi:hypothetical protein
MSAALKIDTHLTGSQSKANQFVIHLDNILVLIVLERRNCGQGCSLEPAPGDQWFRFVFVKLQAQQAISLLARGCMPIRFVNDRDITEHPQSRESLSSM